MTSRVVPAMRRHDRGLAARQTIEQCRFPGVRRTGNGDDRDRRAAARPGHRRPAMLQSRHAIAAQHEAPDGPDPQAHPLRRKNRSVPRPSARASINRRRQASARSPIKPLSCRNANCRCADVSAAMRSARPSTAVRSSLPFSKARRVNSPASARRHPSIVPKRIEHARQSPRGRHEPAVRRRPRRSRCAAPETTAPSASSMTSPLPDRAPAQARLCAARAHGRSASQAQRRHAARKSAPPQSPPAAVRRTSAKIVVCADHGADTTAT